MDGEKTSVIQAAGGLLWRGGPGDREVLIIFRPRYDDWSLPKGKLDKSETWEAAALREVEEETGYKAILEEFVGCISYLVKGAPKVVLFWNMSAPDENNFQRSEEVDEIAWLPPYKALEKLRKPGERSLLRDHPFFE